jgi:hypothetical protein
LPRFLLFVRGAGAFDDDVDDDATAAVQNFGSGILQFNERNYFPQLAVVVVVT